MRFTVFLPVRNGGSYLQQCVASVLGQTYPDFQLVILDNASSDGTTEWVSSLKDARVVHARSEHSLSIQASWKRVLHYSPKNEFMTIIGHDDLLDRSYLETVHRLIVEHPDARLYQTHFRLIDFDGKLVRPCLAMPERESAAEFLESRMIFKRDSYGTGHMFRSSAYEEVGGIPAYEKLLFADDALWVKLMLGSWKATAKETCFSYRVHSGSTSFSPEPDALYEALDSYLAFLQDACLQDAHIFDVVKRRLRGYLTKIYQSGYFLLRKNPDKFRMLSGAIKGSIERSSQNASRLLSIFDAKMATDFPEMVHRKVFTFRAYCIWDMRVKLRNLRRKLRNSDNPLP